MKSTASIEITLPPVQTGMVALKLHVQGQVVRVDSEDDELIGFAISSDTIVLCDGAKHNVVEYTRMLTIR